MLIDPRRLILIAEVEQRDQLLPAVIAADPQDMIVVGLHDPDIRLPVKDRVLLPEILHPADRGEHLSLPRGQVMALRRVVPVHGTAVQIPAVVPLQRIIVVSVIIQLRDLVARIQHRDAALREQKGMQHDVQLQRPVELSGIPLILRRLHAAQRRGCAAESGVSEPRIVIVKLSAGVAAENVAAEVIIEEFLVRHLLDAELAEVLIIETPADIVVAAEIIQEGILLRQREHRLKLMLQQTHIVRRHRVPCARHRRDVVEHVAFRLVYRAKIRHHLARLHDHLAEQQRARTDNITGHVHDPHQRVNLRQIAAGGPQRFPDIRRRVETDDINALVAQIEHVVRHIVENGRIAVIEIPLVWVEGRHDDLVRLLAPGEIARRRLREDLRDRLLELVRNVPVVEEEIPVLVLLLPCLRPPRPFMVLRGMIHDKIQADTHAVFMAGTRESREILHRAELRLYRAVVRHSVAAVAPARRALKQRHQMNIVDAALSDVIQMLPDPLQIARKALRIHQHARQRAVLVPVRHHFPGLVQLLQLPAPALIIPVQHTAKVVKRLLISVIQLPIEPLHLVIIAAHTFRKNRVPCR